MNGRSKMGKWTGIVDLMRALELECVLMEGRIDD